MVVVEEEGTTVLLESHGLGRDTRAIWRAMRAELRAENVVVDIVNDECL